MSNIWGYGLEPVRPTLDQIKKRVADWETRRFIAAEEQERIAYLNRTPAPNPPELVKPTRVRVLRPFCVAGDRVEVGAITTLARADADSLVALGKAEID